MAPPCHCLPCSLDSQEASAILLPPLLDTLGLTCVCVQQSLALWGLGSELGPQATPTAIHFCFETGSQ